MNSIFKRITTILGISHLIIQLILIIPVLIHNDNDRDMFIYQHAAQQVYRGLSPYDVELQRNYDALSQPNRGYVYPPPFAVTLIPFSGLSPKMFVAFWLGILFIAFWSSAAALSFLLWGKHKLEGILGFGLILGAWPGVYLGFGLGQIDLVLLALFAAGLAFRREVLCWALAVVVKIFFIWPLAVLLLARKKSINQLIIGIIPALLWIAVSGWIAGWQLYITWFKDILPTLSQGSWVAGNVSLSFAVLRLLNQVGWWTYEGGKIAGLPQFWLTCASIGAPVLAYLLTRHKTTQFQCAIVIAAAVLFAPVCWTTYTALLLPAIILIWKSRKTSTIQKSSNVFESTFAPQ